MNVTGKTNLLHKLLDISRFVFVFIVAWPFSFPRSGCEVTFFHDNAHDLK